MLRALTHFQCLDDPKCIYLLDSSSQWEKLTFNLLWHEWMHDKSSFESNTYQKGGLAPQFNDQRRENQTQARGKSLSPPQQTSHSTQHINNLWWKELLPPNKICDVINPSVFVCKHLSESTLETTALIKGNNDCLPKQGARKNESMKQHVETAVKCPWQISCIL